MLMNAIVQFLSFFRFAIQFLSLVFIFSVLIILPVHLKYTGKYGIPGWDTDDGDEENCDDYVCDYGHKKDGKKFVPDPTYLWIYVIFTYVFTGLAVYLLLQRTNKIIRIRQKFLGGQTSTTDRTVRLSGIPPDMRSEDTIKGFIESLEVGKVEGVTLCRDWHELDSLVDERLKILRQLERAWTKHIGYKRPMQDGNSVLLTQQRPSGSSQLLDDSSEQAHLLSESRGEFRGSCDRPRPRIRLWYGPFRLQYRKVDAIDYYEERLRRIDEKIEDARKKEYPPTELAFVTMESIAASQTLVQTIISPRPMRLFARLAPAPADVVWKNTYLPRSRRMTQAWFITSVIGFLTIFWSFLLIPIAYVLELETLHKVFPHLADLLSEHPLAKSLIQTGLPTLALSLLTVAVPYLYNCWYLLINAASLS